MSTPRTILFVHSGRDWLRGSERVLLDLAANLPAERYRPVVWCDAKLLRKSCIEAGIPCVEATLPGTPGQPWWRARPGVLELAGNVLHAVKADLVHVNMLDCLPWALRASRKARLPTVAHLHLPTSLEDRVWSGLHQASAIVGVSRSSLDWVASDGLDWSAVHLIYNGVVPKRLEQGEATSLRAQLGIPPNTLLAVIVGSLIPLKGVDTVIAAMGQTRETIHLAIVGGGEEHSRLRGQAETGQVLRRVHFLGDRDDVGPILRDAADVLVSAATSETLGLNVIEAGYFGLPVVVSDIPAHREIVDPGRTGLVFPPADSTELARLLQLLDRDTGLCRRLGEAAKADVRRRFLADRMFSEFCDLYDQLSSRSRWFHGWLAATRVPPCYVKFGLNRVFRRRGPSINS